jgi:hypothetical protein
MCFLWGTNWFHICRPISGFKPHLVTAERTRGSYLCWCQYLLAAVLTTAVTLQTTPTVSLQASKVQRGLRLLLLSWKLHSRPPITISFINYLCRSGADQNSQLTVECPSRTDMSSPLSHEWTSCWRLSSLCPIGSYELFTSITLYVLLRVSTLLCPALFGVSGTIMALKRRNNCS